jgi:hypothetical protein
MRKRLQDGHNHGPRLVPLSTFRLSQRDLVRLIVSLFAGSGKIGWA